MIFLKKNKIIAFATKPFRYYDKRNFNDPRKTVSDSDAASGKISRISKSFQRSKQELKKYFSRH